MHVYITRGVYRYVYIYIYMYIYIYIYVYVYICIYILQDYAIFSNKMPNSIFIDD